MNWKELTARIRIDRNALDDELTDQPELFFHASRNYASAIGRRDEAKDELKKVDAELHFSVRKELNASGEKVTESSVAARIESHPDHLQARDSLTEAQREVELYEALKDSFRARGYVLGDLCQLYLSGYYQRASVSGDGARNVQRAEYDALKSEINDQRTRGERDARMTRGTTSTETT